MADAARNRICPLCGAGIMHGDCSNDAAHTTDTRDLRQRYEALLVEHGYLDAHGCGCGWNPRPFGTAIHAAHVTGELLAVRDEELRCAILERDLQQYETFHQGERAKAAERRLAAEEAAAEKVRGQRDRLIPLRHLVETALHLRQHGEYAPGGTENWADWDRDAEATLRAALDGGQ